MSKCEEMIYRGEKAFHKSDRMLSKRKLREIFPSDSVVSLEFHMVRRRVAKHAGKGDKPEERRGRSPKHFDKKKEIWLR